MVPAWPMAGGAATAGLAATPRQTEGPFYPLRHPDDADNDLVRVAGMAEEARGDVLMLSGRVLRTSGEPVVGAVVEIWQCDAAGRYLHPSSGGALPYDSGFQGFGRHLTDDGGRYSFRTIVPVPYSGRTPHIHVKVLRRGETALVTQFYLAGYAQNARDVLFRSLSAERRELVSMTLAPVGGASRRTFATQVDIVTG
jgi:protocatechuate 3,4-dioxygenase beta subunit